MFQILNAQVTDTGRYVCVAENMAGSAEKYFSLNVHGEVFNSFRFILSQKAFHCEMCNNVLKTSHTYIL